MGSYLTHLVQKSFDDSGTRRLSGECVNALGYRTHTQLVSQRYLISLPEGADPIPDSEGRFWIDAAALEDAERQSMETGGMADETTTNGTEATVAFEPPVKVKRNRYRMGDGSVFSGSAKAALAAHQLMLDELRAEQNVSSVAGG